MSHRFVSTSISIVIEPSFSGQRSVYYQECYVDGEQKHIIGGAIAEDRTSDPQTWERELSRAEAEKLKNAIKQVSISLDFTAPSCVLDGTTWKFGMRSGKSCITLDWWEELPPDWKSLKPLINRLIMMAESKEPPRWWEFWKL